MRVTALEFSNGDVVQIPTEGTVLLVGPNNAGKSQTLRDIKGSLRQDDYVGRTLSRIEFVKESDESIVDWVVGDIPVVNRDGVDRYSIEGWGEVQRRDILAQWGLSHLNVLTDLFVLHADGTSRLSAGDSQASIDFSVQVPTHPVQRAYIDGVLEAEIDREGLAAFGLGVTVDRYGGSMISLRLGPRPEFAHDEGRPSEDYLQALKRLPKLEEQGDGVRSYLGLVIHIASGAHQILLIDEPEAFLHPPQARRLGGVLAQKAIEQQAFMATHSADVVQGALESKSAITIIRITRDGDLNHPSVLSDEAVRELWSDPLLRYSNVLDGLFHDAVVLCEGDADCRYYSAVLDHLRSADENATPDQRMPQLLFTHCGGKARMASVVEALRAVSVPVIVVADFDVMRNADDVKKIVTALGGEYDQLSQPLTRLDAALKSDTKPLRKLALRDELLQRLDDLPNETISTREADALRSAIKAETGWDKAKRSGLGAVPQGDAYKTCEELLANLKSLNLFVVPVGELERFAPSVPGHGPNWVTAVLESKLHESPSAEAVAFVSGIIMAAQN